jgi:hypothetical protein
LGQKRGGNRARSTVIHVGKKEKNRREKQNVMVLVWLCTSNFLTDFYFCGSKLIELPCSPPIAGCLPALLDRSQGDHGPFDLVRG